MLFDTSGADIEMLGDDLFLKKQVSVSVLRLDKIHPLLSGNKLFKLHYFLSEAVAGSHKTILTFGGAFSNHLSATAFACHVLNIGAIGIVRGERPNQLSHTLQQCLDNGMQLKFVSRQEYAQKDDPAFIQELADQYGNCTIVPEGGFHVQGARGAALIMDLVKNNDYTHICTATGTATTLAGLLMSAKPTQTIMGFTVLKGITDNKNRIKQLTATEKGFDNLYLEQDYHFGGYAKKTDQLIHFMNECWQNYRLPLDFVYTAKMFYGVMDKIKNDAFPAGSRILCIHTGGLQGNKSLPLNTLLF